ncbi:hypothetical protein NFX46_19475 [Streptomyces phaeoluteigriseus]|uniref:Secreted protein n=1 Tax=Streptomyces phaeoluteigriseus TaxID=114686 RepID=A0ABY4Z9N8_9ACTN|nr:hypothetical protein [Streptomyces phaeoluteigriseus]USQ85748.1 hypothetical protein NFX46_19475 [Streptomyces phaeoluteigriseus]
MNTDLLVGVIALLGTFVGAAAAFTGVVYQQRHQARLVREERRDVLAEKAVDTLIMELEKVKFFVGTWPDDAMTPEHAEHLFGHIAELRLAALRVPHEELRESIEAACVLAFGNERSFREHIGFHENRLLMKSMCHEAQRCLGAYLRQEPLPQTQFLWRAHSFAQSMYTIPDTR